MKLFPAVLALLLVSPFSSAFVPMPVDSVSEFCDSVAGAVFALPCSLTALPDTIGAVIDSSNKLSEDELLAGLDNSDTDRDVEVAILKHDIGRSTQRVGTAWGNILSVVMVLLEVVLIVFYLAQIFILVHLPYWYVKLLVVFKERAFVFVRRRKR